MSLFIWAIITKEILPELVSGQERIIECFIMITGKAGKELRNLEREKKYHRRWQHTILEYQQMGIGTLSRERMEQVL